MPALTENPPQLGPDGATSPADLADVWWLVQVKPRQEKRLAAELRWLSLTGDHRVGYYLPMVESVGVRGTSLLCSFPGWLFVNAEEGFDFDRMRATHRIVRILPVRDQSQLRRDLAKTFQAIELQPRRLFHDIKPHGRVRVKSGPFEGTVGVVAEIDGVRMVVLTVEILGRGTPLEIEPHHLEPV